MLRIEILLKMAEISGFSKIMVKLLWEKTSKAS